MSVRILCLHGMGVNATIFEKQIAPVRKLLPLNYELVFMRGLMPCNPAPGVTAVHPGPYECWYDTPTTFNVKNAHRAVLDYAYHHGPFDGIMGFSQGGAVAASILLHHEFEGRPPPFRFAIFLCSPLPFSYNLEHGIDARAAFGERNDRPARPNCPNRVPSSLIPESRYLRGEKSFRRPKRSDSVISTSEIIPESFYQLFHASVDQVRIRIPTGHLVGEHDEWKAHSLSLVDLCAVGTSTVLHHSGGHEIPRDYEDDICDLIEALGVES